MAPFMVSSDALQRISLPRAALRRAACSPFRGMPYLYLEVSARAMHGPACQGGLACCSGPAHRMRAVHAVHGLLTSVNEQSVGSDLVIDHAQCRGTDCA